VSRNDFLSRICHRLDELMLFPAAVRRDDPDPATAGILVALSGGPDSVALLLAVRAWGRQTGRPVGAAHLNHRLRGADADADTEFCRNLCAGLHVPLFEHDADPRPVARARGLGLEEAGRHLRRTFCEGLLAEHRHYRWIAAGHHRDDQIETVLMRLFRGTGPEGLRGIRPVNGTWIRPLLAVSRTEIIAFLEAVQQPWRTDVSNLAGDNTRARLRRELLPLLRSIFGAGCAENPARLAELWDDDLVTLATLTAEWLDDCRDTDESLSVAKLTALDPGRARRVLRAWLAASGTDGLERVHVENIRRWLVAGVSGSTLDLPDGLKLTREFARIRWSRGELRGPALRFAGDYRIVVKSGTATPDAAATAAAAGVGIPDDESTWSLTCPAASLHGNLQTRNWRQGDRFKPFGMAGTKKLSDLLRENRVTRDDRSGVLVVTDDEGILWVVGLARAERTRLLPSTSRTVTISVIKRIGSNQTRENN